MALCLVGLYPAFFMLRKQIAAARGELRDPSVVMSPRARVFGGIPNALWGLAYYVAVLVAVPFLAHPAVWLAVLVASAAAALFSLYLAYSLLFVTRMPCPYCWTGHVVNWSLLILIIVARAARNV